MITENTDGPPAPADPETTAVVRASKKKTGKSSKNV